MTWSSTPLAGEGLPEPPGGLSDCVGPAGDGRWGTRAAAPGLRRAGWFEAEARHPAEGPGWVLAGFEDVASGMPALHYLLRYGPVALYVQAEAARDDAGRLHTTSRGRSHLAGADELQSEALRRWLGSEGTLLVVETLYGTDEWAWIDPSASTVAPAVGGNPAVSGALEWLAQRPFGEEP